MIVQTNMPWVMGVLYYTWPCLYQSRNARLHWTNSPVYDTTSNGRKMKCCDIILLTRRFHTSDLLGKRHLCAAVKTKKTRRVTKSSWWNFTTVLAREYYSSFVFRDLALNVYITTINVPDSHSFSIRQVTYFFSICSLLRTYLPLCYKWQYL